MKFLIVSGGDVDDAFLSNMIKKGGYEVISAVDSGMEFLYRSHIIPDIIVGDLDSVNPDVLDYFRAKEYIDFCILSPDKDDTDTEYAVRDAIERGATDITITGATGSRLDHELGNIALLGIGLEKGVDIRIIDPHNRIRMIDKPITLKKSEQYGKYISLLPYSDRVESVTLTGFKYNLTDRTMEGFNSLGVSNEMTEDEATITFKSGQLLVIESKD